MNKITGGQRGTSAIALFGLLILGGVLGTPGQYPTINGQQLSPDVLVGAPIVIFIVLVWALIKAINTRVLEGSIKPGDILALLQMREFWVAAVAAVAGGLNLFHVHILDDPSAQLALLTLLQGGAALLVHSWATRPGMSTPRSL